MLGRTSTKTLTGIDQNKLNEQELKSLQLEVDQIETEIEQIEAEQLIQNADILQNSADIDTNTQGIAANLVSIEALEAEQVVQNTNINLNSIDIDDLETRADAFDIEQDTQNTNILANANAIIALDTRTTALETQTNSLQSQLTGFQTDTLQELNDITTDLTALQTTVSQNKTAADNEFSDIQQQLVDLDIRITQNRQDIDQNFLYIEILMTSVYYNKNEIDNQFLQLRGTWTGSISELKDGLDSLIAGLTVRMGQAETNITGLQARMTTEEQQTTQQWSAISDLQSFDTSLQNQITANDGDISTLQTKTQYISSNSTTTFVDSDLVVDKNIVCDKLTCMGTVPENPGLVIIDEAGSAILSFDSLALNGQGNPVVLPGDGRIVASNTGETGVLTLSTNSTTRAGVRITKDHTTISGNTLNIRNSDDNLMTSVARATADSAILAHFGNIHTNSIRHRSIFAGVGVVGSINGSYNSITPLISSMTNFSPNNVNFFVINPGFKIETYSGTNYGGSQNVFNNTLGNFTSVEAAIGSVQSIKLFFRNMNGSETQILL